MPLSEDEIRRITRHTVATAPLMQPPASTTERAAHAPRLRISIHEAVRRRGANITETVRTIVDDEISKVMADPDRLAADLPKAPPVVPTPVKVETDPYEPWDPRWPPILKSGLRKALKILECGM